MKEIELTGKKIFWIGCIIFFCALSVRLFYLYESSDNPIFKAPIVDARGYDYIAGTLVQKGKMEDLFFWQQFFYPFFLSIVYFFSGCSIVAAKIVQAVLGSLICVLTFLLARKVFSFRTGIIAGIAVIFYGPLIFHESDLISAGWEALWAVILLWLFLKAANNKQSFSIYVLIGICGAFSTLTRPNFLIFFVAACVWLMIVYCRFKKRILAVNAMAAILVSFAFVVLPVAILNSHITGHFGIMPASGGINLYIGNNPDFDAASIRPGPKWEELTAMPVKYGIKNDMWDKQEFFYDKALRYIVSHPANFLKGLIIKTMQVINSREMPGNVDVYLFRNFSILLRALMWKAGPFGFPFGLILPLSVVGLVYFWRQIPMPMKLFLLIYPLPLVVTHIESRYRIAMIPVLVILAAAGIDTFIKQIKHFRRSMLVAAVMLFVLVLLLSTLPGPFASEKMNYLPELYNSVGATLVSQGKLDEALENYKKAIGFDAKYSEAYYNLGVLYYQQGDKELAMQNYEKALQSEPNDYKSHYNLGVVLCAMGDFESAETHYLEALRLKPDYILVRKALVTDFIRRGELDNAIEQLRQILEIDSGDAETHYQMGMLLVQKNEVAPAIQEFEKTLQLNPDHSDARQILNSLKTILNK